MTAFSIQIPKDYFARTAAKEYTDAAGLALVREFAQNSADAGATTISFDFGADGWLTVTDNGRGCDPRRVRDVLLCPLGSEKEADAVGGFGKAKELLYFANAQWHLRTQTVEATGSYLDVRAFLTDRPHLQGFIANVQLPPALWQKAREEAEVFLQHSERPGVRWLLNGQEVHVKTQRPKRATRDFGFCKAYLNPDVRDAMVYLRTGGLLTSRRWGYHDSEVGQVVIEVTGASSELLTPARDWFRNSDHRRVVESWLNELQVNLQAALAEEVGDEILFEDFEVVQPVAHPGDVRSAKSVPQTNGIDAKVTFLGPKAPAESAAVVASEHATGESLDVAVHPEVARVLKTVTHAKVKRKDGFDMRHMPRVPGVQRLTVHTGSKARAKMATQWLKKKQAHAARLLAAWMTAVTAVAARNKLPVDAIGFTFKEGNEAEYVATNGRWALLLNPMTIDLQHPEAAEELLDRALHETAHLAGSAGHDERFVLTELRLRRATRGTAVRGAVARSIRTGTVETVEAL